MDDLKKAFTQVDRTIDHKDMERYVCWVFKVDSDPSRLKSGQPKTLPGAPAQGSTAAAAGGGSGAAPAADEDTLQLDRVGLC